MKKINMDSDAQDSLTQTDNSSAGGWELGMVVPLLKQCGMDEVGQMGWGELFA